MNKSPKDKAQLKHFKEAARELGADESEEAFDKALKKIAQAPQEPKKSKPSKDQKR
jgi:hypothetical protein